MEKQQQFQDLVLPLITFLRENYNPHTTIIITPLDAELVEGVMVYSPNDLLAFVD